MIPPPDCLAREDDPCVYDRGGYEPDWEDLAYDLAREREFEETVSHIHESKRQLRHYDEYTDRQLWRLNKQAGSGTHYLASEFQFDVDANCFEVSEDLENYVTVPRNLTRKDKRRIKGNLRRHLRKHFGILAKRGCSPRKVKGYEDGSSATVVAAK
jgi:hypothetical protein